MSASWQESVFARLNEQPATPVSPSAPVPGSGRVDGVYVTSQPQSTVAIGSPISRVDGRAKVMGQARYVAEHTAPDICYGVAVCSTIARGRITAIDSSTALLVPGVLAVMTHENRPRMRSMRIFHKDMDAPGGKPFRPLQ